MKNRSIAITLFMGGLILSSCSEDIQKPYTELQNVATTEGDDSPPDPIPAGGND